MRTCFPFASSVLEIHTITQTLLKHIDQQLFISISLLVSVSIWSFSSSLWLFYFKPFAFLFVCEFALLTSEFFVGRGLIHL